MREAFAEKHHNLEDTHWFLRGRRALIKRLLRSRKRTTRILEVGCSTGALLAELLAEGFSSIFGVDIDASAVAASARRGLTIVTRIRPDVPLPFATGTFDMIVSSDVLEHIREEQYALREWHRVLKSEGELLILVPAFQFLWSDHDVVNGHFRRYTKKTLTDVLKKNGFTINRVSYWNVFLFLPIALVRLLQRLLPRQAGKVTEDQLHDDPLWMSVPLGLVLRFENMLLGAGVNFPFGVSVVVHARVSGTNKHDSTS